MPGRLITALKHAMRRRRQQAAWRRADTIKARGLADMRETTRTDEELVGRAAGSYGSAAYRTMIGGGTSRHFER